MYALSLFPNFNYACDSPPFSAIKSASSNSTRQKETSVDVSVDLSDSGEESPVKNGELSALCVCACMSFYSFQCTVLSTRKETSDDISVEHDKESPVKKGEVSNFVYYA